MPYELRLDKSSRALGWKVKIRDKERLEPPHVTIIKGTKSWRWDLRRQVFMDPYPPTKEVPEDLVTKLKAEHSNLKKQWDLKYPENKV